MFLEKNNINLLLKEFYIHEILKLFDEDDKDYKVELIGDKYYI